MSSIGDDGKTRNLLWPVGRVLQKECVKLVSDQEILLCWVPLTSMKTHLSRLREISPSRAQSSSSASGFSHSMAGRTSFTKRRTTWKKGRKKCYVGPISQGKARVKKYQQESDHTKITSYKKATVIATTGRRRGPEQWSPQEERSRKNWAL